MRSPWMAAADQVMWTLYYIQRIPAIVLFTLTAMISYGLYRLTGIHDIWMGCMRVWIRLYHWSSGIRIVADRKALAGIEAPFVVANIRWSGDYLALLEVLPYRKIVVAYPDQFSPENLRRLICYFWLMPVRWMQRVQWLNGFFPAQPVPMWAGSMPDWFEPYYTAGFMIVDSVDPQWIDQRAPYILPLAQQAQAPIQFLKIEAKEPWFATVFTPQKVRITKAGILTPAKTVAETIRKFQEMTAEVYPGEKLDRDRMVNEALGFDLKAVQL